MLPLQVSVLSSFIVNVSTMYAIPFLTLLATCTANRGLCPRMPSPQQKVTFLSSPGYPRPSIRGGQCKFELKVNYGEYIKLEKIEQSIRCSGKSGIMAVEHVNIESKQKQWKTGDVSPISRFESKLFCGPQRMPPFASNDVQLTVIITFGMGDKWRFGYKSMSIKKGPFIPRTKPKLTTRAPPRAPVTRATQVPPWVPPSGGHDPNAQGVHSQHSQGVPQHPQGVPQGPRGIRPAGNSPMDYRSQYYGYGMNAPVNYPDYGQPSGQHINPADYGVHHQLPPSGSNAKEEEPPKEANKFIIVFGAFGIVILLVAVVGGGLYYKQSRMKPPNPTHIPMK